MKKYVAQPPRRRWPKRFVWCVVVLAAVLIIATIGVRVVYSRNLRPVNSASQVFKSEYITIEQGASAKQIAQQLKQHGLIRSVWAFEWYVSSKEVRNSLQAGSYMLASNQSIPEIVSQLTHGRIVTNLLTILPAQRLDQVRQIFARYGYSQAAIDTALDSKNYVDHPALVDKPPAANLEGYLYPDSFQKTAQTDLSTIVRQSLDEMNKHLTPELRAAFTAQGLTVYQGITLASIVEQEVSNPSDRAQAAQVFLKRLHSSMMLGSDVTAFYGARLAGQTPSVSYDSPYNTRLHTGLPPTPIGNISDSSLQAVAHPAATDWLFFVSGDDGKTYFSHTQAEHDALTAQYCHKLCSE